MAVTISAASEKRRTKMDDTFTHLYSADIEECYTDGTRTKNRDFMYNKCDKN